MRAEGEWDGRMDGWTDGWLTTSGLVTVARLAGLPMTLSFSSSESQRRLLLGQSANPPIRPLCTTTLGPSAPAAVRCDWGRPAVPQLPAQATEVPAQATH